nr:hypothetical protein [Marinicella sp. W31]MDC2877421.1 hypothetical protein [Marinicella sp. W31]
MNSYVGGHGAGAGLGGTVSVSHYGAISTKGGYADGILAHSIGGGGGNAGTGSGSTKASNGIKTAALNIGLGAKGGVGNFGGNVDVHMDDSAASIYTGGHVSRGIFAQSIGGGGGSSSGGGGSGDADWAITIGLGAEGSGGGSGGNVTISSEGTIVTKGDWSDAILAQSIGGGGGAAGSGKSSLRSRRTRMTTTMTVATTMVMTPPNRRNCPWPRLRRRMTMAAMTTTATATTSLLHSA